MSAHPGNRYAEKWTHTNTLHALEYIRTFAAQDDCLYLGMALSRAGYYDDLWAYWRRKWRTDPTIITMMKTMLQVFQARLFEKTAKGTIPVRVGMFALSHHYGWGREPKPTIADQYREPDFEPEEIFDGDPDLPMEAEEELYHEDYDADGEDDDDPSLEQQLADEVQRIRAERATTVPADRSWLSPTQRAYYAEQINRYNVDHPGALITHLMAYRPGPSTDPHAIPFDGGHFVHF